MKETLAESRDTMGTADIMDDIVLLLTDEIPAKAQNTSEARAT